MASAAGGIALVIGTDKQVAGLAGIHDVVGEGADGLAELHFGVGGYLASNAFFIRLLETE